MMRNMSEVDEVESRHSATEHLKREQSAQLAADTAAFIANGGAITAVPIGAINDIVPGEWTKGVMRNG